MDQNTLERRWIEAAKQRQAHEARADRRYAARMPVEPTLGDRIVADRKLVTK